MPPAHVGGLHGSGVLDGYRRRADSACPPDLLILDIPAHRATIGWTVLDYLTTDPTTAPIPLLVCSTSPVLLADVEQRGFRTFAEPFLVPDVLDLVARAVAMLARPQSEATQ